MYRTSLTRLAAERIGKTHAPCKIVLIEATGEAVQAPHRVPHDWNGMNFSVGFDISGVDPGFKEHSTRGIGRYVRELWHYFQTQTAGDIAVRSFDHRDFRAGGALDRLIEVLPAGRQTLRQQLLYPLRMGRRRTAEYDVLHFPAHMDAPSWSPKPYVLTVLDLIPLVLADLYQPEVPNWRFAFGRLLEVRAIKQARLLLAISQHTAGDLERVLKIPPERIAVTPLGVDPVFFSASARPPERKQEVAQRYGLPEARRWILYVGGIDPRKNWRGLLDSFARLCGRLGEARRPQLVIAGRIERDRQYPLFCAHLRRLQLEDKVSLAGFVTEADLLTLYAGSSVFFFPSLYEGFGLPVLEAMAAGVPVVSSNRSSLPEVAGDAARLVDPTDAAASAAALEELLENSARGAVLRERGRAQAKKFSWQRTGESTLQAYRQVAAAARGRRQKR